MGPQRRRAQDNSRQLAGLILSFGHVEETQVETGSPQDRSEMEWRSAAVSTDSGSEDRTLAPATD